MEGRHIGQMLRAVRGARSQAEACRLCDVPQATWSVWERRATAAGSLAEGMAEILDALGATPQQREEIGRAIVGLALVRA